MGTEIKMEKTREQKWRHEIKQLSDEELIDELQRPSGNWKKDVNRETLCRILFRLIKLE